MKHRVNTGINLGLGSGEPDILTNNFDFTKISFHKELAEDLIKTFRVMKDYGGFDFELTNGGISFGIEPAYMHEKLEIVHFDFTTKMFCTKTVGIAKGAYGTKVWCKLRNYNSYKSNSPFVKFINRWFDKLSAWKGGEK